MRAALIRLFLLALAASGARADVVQPLPYPIVYVRAPYFGPAYDAGLPNAGNSTWPDTVQPLIPDAGAVLMLLRSDGSRTRLFPLDQHRALLDTPAMKPLSVGSVADPNVSFDGRHVVFAWYHDLSPEARNAQRGGLSLAGADVYEIDVATLAARRLTHQEFTPNTGNGADFSAAGNHPRIGVFNTGPTYVGGERIVFTSSRNNLLPAKQASSVQRVLQLFAMDRDGANVEQIGHLNLGMALHPQVLMDGRVMFSSWEMQGLRDFRSFALWVIAPDGRNWNSLSGYSDRPFVHHFATQMPDGDIVVGRYYNLNNNGFGTLIRYPIDPPGRDFLSDDPDPQSGTIPHERRDPLQPAELRRDLAPFTTHRDYPAPCPGFETNAAGSAFAPYPCASGDRRGKLTHPQATPPVAGIGSTRAELLAVYSPGSANHRTPGPGTPATPWYHGEIVLLPDGEAVGVPAACADGPGAGCPPGMPSGLVRVLAEDGYNLQWPRPLVSYRALYGIDAPVTIAPLTPAAITSEGLVPGEPFGVLGSSSLIWRDTLPARSLTFADRDPFNPFNWDYTWSWIAQGTDAGLYADDDIHAVRVLMQEPLSDLAYPDNSPQHITHGRERLRILGEVPVRGALSGKPGNPVSTLPDGRIVADTSFLVRVPADVSVMFQAVDHRGLALNTAQTWHQVRPGEARYDCGGCHAHSKQDLDFASTAAARSDYAMRDIALSTPLLALTSAGADALDVRTPRAVSIEYFRDVVPILDARCAQCHGANNAAGPGPGLRLASNAPPVEGWPAAYHALALNGVDPITGVAYTRTGSGQAIQPTRYVRALQARQSLLMWAIWNSRLDGRTNATRGDDIDFTGHPAIAGLTNTERMTLARWIDTGAGIELRGRANPGDSAGQQDLWGYDDDDLRPTVVLNPRDDAASGYVDALELSAFDVESGVDTASGRWHLSADRAIGGVGVGVHLSPTTAIPENGGVLRINLPTRVSSPITFTLQVQDRAGNSSVIRRHLRLDRLFADGFEP